MEPHRIQNYGNAFVKEEDHIYFDGMGPDIAEVEVSLVPVPPPKLLFAPPPPRRPPVSDEPGEDGQFAYFNCPAPNCSHRYRRKGDLKVHALSKHKDDRELAETITRSRRSKVGKPFCCHHPNCPSGYTRRSDLVRHLREKHSDLQEKRLIFVEHYGHSKTH